MLERIIYAQKELVSLTCSVTIRTEGSVLELDRAKTGIRILREKDGSVTSLAATPVATVLMTGMSGGEEMAELASEELKAENEMYFSYYDSCMIPAAGDPMQADDIEDRIRGIEKLREETFLEVELDRETFVETVNRLSDKETKKSRTIFATDSLGSTLEEGLFNTLKNDSIFNMVEKFTPLAMRFNEDGAMVAKNSNGASYKIRPYVDSFIPDPEPGVAYKGFLVNQPEDGILKAFVSARFSHFKVGLHVSDINFKASDLQEASEMMHIPEDLIIRTNKVSKENIRFFPVSIDTGILVQMSRIFLDASVSPSISVLFTGDPNDPVLFEAKGDGDFPDIVVAINTIRPTALATHR